MSFEFFVALRHLMSRRRRDFISVITGISILGVIVGVAALVAVVSVMDGANRDYFNQLIDVFAHIEVYNTMGDMRDYEGVVKIVASDPDVIAAAPLLKRPAALKVASQTSGTSDAQSMGFAVIMGIDPKVEGKVTRISGAPAPGEKGRGTGNMVPGDREVVVGSGVAEQIGVKVGDSVVAIANSSSAQPNAPSVKQARLRVVGIFDSGIYDLDRQIAYTSIATCQKINSLGDTVDLVHAKLKDPQQADAVRDRIVRALEARYGRTFLVRTWKELNPPFFQALRIQRLAMFIILSLIIVVAALSIISTLFLVTMEKTREIGVLRAMGTSRGSILRIFIIEGALVGFVGTFLGVVLGLVVCWFLKYHFPIELPEAVYNLKGLPVAVKWTTILEIVCCSIGISLSASVIPAYQASRLDVVEALRYD